MTVMIVLDLYKSVEVIVRRSGELPIAIVYTPARNFPIEMLVEHLCTHSV
jgi:hypothetical protein